MAIRVYTGVVVRAERCAPIDA